MAVDSEVTNSGQIYQFAQSPITQAVDLTTTAVHVGNAALFPPAPGRFDLDNEMMTYSGLDLTNNLLTGVTRGVDGTVVSTHTLGTAAEGQAYLTIVDPAGLLDAGYGAD